MKGAAGLAVLCLSAGTAFGQEPPLARAALLQCLMTASDPGLRVDRICAGLAEDVCGVGRGEVAAAECRAELACRFLEEGQVVNLRVGAAAAWGSVSDGCRGQADAASCLQDAAREWWLSAREAARGMGASLAIAEGEVARCWLE